MAKTILPSGEEISTTPKEILRYVNADALRQILRQDRLRWNLKANKDVDYYDKIKLSKHTGELHNFGNYQRLEIRTFPDNNANPGYSGINNDSGTFGLPHDIELWDNALSDTSKKTTVNRTIVGSLAKIKNTSGYGLDDNKKISKNTNNRMSMLVFDPADGRSYLLSNDAPHYVNNESRKDKIPGRAVARITDIPTRITHLHNDLNFVSDPDYIHTDNNFTNSNRYVLDNLDDRTFVYPEISRDRNGGDFVENDRVGLNGEFSYGESDGSVKQNTQPDLGVNPQLGNYGDRFGEAISSYNKNVSYSGIGHKNGYLPGIFRSVEELERVDIVDQTMTPRTHKATPGAKRFSNYYIHDGLWSSNWFDKATYRDSYLAQSMNPINMEIYDNKSEPRPYSSLEQSDGSLFNMNKLFQWRYNRITIKYYSKDIYCHILKGGEDYTEGDILVWSFSDDSFEFEVKMVGSNGEILQGEFRIDNSKVYNQDPSTHGIGVSFANKSSVGRGAKIVINSKATIETHATQIKNNLYAYVDITPTVRSDNSTPWSDTKMSDSQDGKITIRSTAAGPGYTGINSGKGGPLSTDKNSTTKFYEHGGNATAGVHVHLFRYVINTENPSWVIRDGQQIFLGKWVDQGPMGLERPCDIKALLFSNSDTNNFNNYYKFNLDTLLESYQNNPDAVVTNNKNAISNAYIHYDQVDPSSDQKFYETIVNPETSLVQEVDVTHKVLYVNMATGMLFMYNQSYKSDPKYGHGLRGPGWISLSGGISK